MSAVVALAATALCLSAMAGAWVQAHHTAFQPAAVAAESSAGKGNAAAMPGHVGMLASKMGDLQARMIELETLSERIADAAGLDALDSAFGDDIQATESSLEASPLSTLWTPGDVWPSDPVSGMADWLDVLRTRVDKKKEWFSLVDSALARRAGMALTMPTHMPIAGMDPGSPFGWRRHPILGHQILHEGVDFAAPYGTPIHAAAAGVVVDAGYKSGYGLTVEVRHGDGLVTRYAHASKLLVKVGEIVEKGQEIAKVGASGRVTGAHLHFEVRVNGRALDPMLFLDKQGPVETLVASAMGGGAGSAKVR